MTFHIQITCNYPDEKEAEAATPSTPLNLWQIGDLLFKLTHEEKDMTSCVITLVRSKA
jgi:hypothetical protein